MQVWLRPVHFSWFFSIYLCNVSVIFTFPMQNIYVNCCWIACYSARCISCKFYVILFIFRYFSLSFALSCAKSPDILILVYRNIVQIYTFLDKIRPWFWFGTTITRHLVWEKFGRRLHGFCNFGSNFYGKPSSQLSREQSKESMSILSHSEGVTIHSGHNRPLFNFLNFLEKKRFFHEKMWLLLKNGFVFQYF